MPNETGQAPRTMEGFKATFSDPIVRLEGVRGWLLWFCILTVIIQPAMNLLAITEVESFIIAALFCALSITTGVMVWQRNPSAFVWLKWYFGIYLAVAVLIAVGGGVLRKPATFAPAVFLLWHVIIWAAYFMKSKRVFANFGRNL